MVKTKTNWAGLTLALLLAGCAGKNQVATTTSGAAGQDEAAGATAEAAPAQVPEAVLEELRVNFQRVQFDFDRADLDQPSRDALTENARILNEHLTVQVRVEGHADQWGSDEYNLALGQRRAEAVIGYLTALGVAEDRLTGISYGELRPLVTDGGDRNTVAPNRRAEFFVTAGSETVGSSY